LSGQSPTGGGTGASKKMTINLMDKAHAAPRCAAKSKRSGNQCKAPAIRGKRVCRMHGGKSPGAPCGKLHGRYVDGRETQQAKAARKEVRDLIRMARQLAALF
jgi:hypothetical protein